MRLLLPGFLAWGALLVLQFVWHVWLQPPVAGATLVVLSLALLPLLLPLLALPRRHRVLLWCAIASIFYFCHGVADFWAHPDLQLLAGLEIALSGAVILAAGLNRNRLQRDELR